MDNSYELTFENIVEGYHKVTYRGIKMIKNPFDYVLYQMILNEVKPDLVIEIGTNYGGSALYISDILNTIGNGIVHTIDINNFPLDDLITKNKRIKRFFDGYQSYDLLNCEGFEKVLVIDDGSHMYDECIEILDKFKNVVSLNSYFIVEDGCLINIGLSKEYNGGPIRAIDEFIDKNDNFIIDRTWCDFFGKNVTFNTNGFLKKIR